MPDMSEIQQESNSTTTIEITKKTPDEPEALNREKLCPFLLRMYYCQAQHHRVDDFTPTSTPPASSELRLYTWKNATLGEITSLVKQAIPDIVTQAGSGGQLAFRHIFLDANRGIFVGRDIGVVRLDNLNTFSSSKKTDDSIPAQGLFTKNVQNKSESAAGPASTAAKPGSGGSTKGYERSLESIKFVIGDYLDIAITSPTAPGFIPPQIQRQVPHGGGPIRNQRRGPRPGRQGGSGGSGGSGAGGGGARTGGARADHSDRFAGRLGGGAFSRNGHGQGFGGRKPQGSLDVQNEPSWKGRGRGR
ncbi:Histone deacetylase complex subunit sap18 [Entomortierella beljakovae]|nr:Histone deacetylase complex subunit sap18 [Entomortierella beljakovae]